MPMLCCWLLAGSVAGVCMLGQPALDQSSESLIKGKGEMDEKDDKTIRDQSGATMPCML